MKWLYFFILLIFFGYEFVLGAPFLVNLTFGAIDLKYQPGQVKILEFGVGERAGMSAYDKLVEAGLCGNADRIWTQFWRELVTLNLPVWFIHGRIGSTSYPSKAALFYEKDFATFKKYGGRLVGSLRELEQDLLFAQLAKNTGSSTKQRINDFKGVVIIDHHCYMNEYHKILKCRKCSDITEFKKRYSDFLFLNEETGYFLRNKHVMQQLFAQDQLLKTYRPNSVLCDSFYSKNLAAEVNKKLQSSVVVVKPLGSCLGRGVVITEKEKLDIVLIDILNKKQRDDYNWKNYMKLPKFIVEGYEPSKFISVDGKSFDATMRVLFFLIHENGQTSVKFLGSCWQLPDYDVQASVSLTKKHKNSFIHEATRRCTVLVSKQDCQEVYRLLAPCLAHACQKMLQFEGPPGGAFFKEVSLYKQ